MNGISRNSCGFFIWSCIFCGYIFKSKLSFSRSNIWIWFWTLKNPKVYENCEIWLWWKHFCRCENFEKVIQVSDFFSWTSDSKCQKPIMIFWRVTKNSRIKSSTLRTREKLVKTLKTLKIQNFWKLWNSRNK